ncbi:MAG: hypothetical protein M0Q38_12365 [Bacteroidales bacterium]|jgi:hypothetical protein|nr:hypothetical protein [Bacteroidales bacterium]
MYINNKIVNIFLKKINWFETQGKPFIAVPLTDAGYRIQDAGYRMLDARYRV